MKFLTLILFFPFVANCQNLFHGCPIGGDSKRQLVREKDSLKNRYDEPKSYKHISLKILLNAKINSIEEGLPVSVSGYVVDVANGSSESCNCHSSVYRDTHIYLAFDNGETDKKKCIVVEVTPRTRTITTSEIKKQFKGKMIEVYGYTFCDEEHKQNSVNDSKSSTNLWRESVWEVHPVFKITLL